MTAIKKIDNDWLSQNTNKVEDTRASRFAFYTGRTLNGANRCLSTTQKTARLANDILSQAGRPTSEILANLDKNLIVAMSALSIVRLYDVSREAYNSIGKLVSNCDGANFSAKVIDVVQKAFDAVATFGYASLFVKYNPIVRSALQVIELAADCTDMAVSTNNYLQAAALEVKASGEVKSAITHSKNYYFVRMVKAIVGIATAILGVIALITSSTVMLTISLSATLIAVFRDLYKDDGKYKVIEFDRTVVV